MPDNLPNPDASVVVTPPAGPPAPQTQYPDMGGQQIPQQPTQAFNPPAQNVPTPQQAQAAHHSKLGMMWNALMPEHTVWGPSADNPNGPPVPTQVKDKPGQLFRSILAGAIMGGAAGAEAHSQNPNAGFAGGFFPGAKAGRQNQQAEQQKSQQQARQQWQDQLTAKKEQREGTAAEDAHTAAADEHTMKFALTGKANQDTLKSALEVQGMSQGQHKQLEDNDKPEVDMMRAAGLKPTDKYSDVPESTVLTMKHDPGFSATHRWLATGTIPTKDKDGNITSYENTYSAFPVQGMESEIPLTQSKIADWKKSGYLEANPNLLTSNVVKKKPDGSMSIAYSDFRNIESQAAPMRADKQKKQAEADAEQERKDHHDLSVAQQRAETARAAAEGNSAALSSYELKTKKDTDAAGKKYQTQGWGSLNGDEKYLVQPLIQKNINDAETMLNSKELKDALDSNDSATVAAARAKAFGYRNTLETESKKLLGPEDQQGKEKLIDPIQATVDSLKGKSAHEVAASLKDPKNKVPDAVKAQVWKKLGMQPPSSLSPLGQGVVNVVNAARPVFNALP